MKTSENRRILLNFDLLEPQEDKIIIAPWFEPNVTENGLLLSDAKKTSYGMGKILKIGPSVDTKVCNVKVGGFVIIRPGVGVMIEGPNDSQYIIMRQSEVLAVVDTTNPEHDKTPKQSFDARGIFTQPSEIN